MARERLSQQACQRIKEVKMDSQELERRVSRLEEEVFGITFQQAKSIKEGYEKYKGKIANDAPARKLIPLAEKLLGAF